MSEKKIILKGIPASEGITKGKAKILISHKDNKKMSKGNILIAPLTNPQYTPAILVASAIVTEVGGILSHAAIVSREIGIPCVVGVKGITKLIKDNQIVEVNGKDGYIKVLSDNN